MIARELDELFRIGAENLKRMEQDEIDTGCDDEGFGDVNHGSKDLLNLPISPITNIFASVCEQDTDNVNINTTKEKEEVQEDGEEWDLDDYWDITVEDVEKA